ncbi:hypothetical protein GQS_06150 [Thermococcus sp. 4557]|uniref:hypothetical protein n=1 Tax=Thermococcus sp. (strain CGMCC 1.5172 / 4557) TaxID=1042877 RepID=UPI000219EF5C|nr:hypothetical protein [Thermococcus sp. 4557]AEK73128.1 hypothetical protein GQS_06150 [Thermococcus sp. 4557]
MAGAKVWKALFVMFVSMALVAVPFVSADTEANSGGQFSIGAVAPQVTDVKFYEQDGKTETTQATPGNKYWINITVSDLNTMDDIKEITIWFYYDTDNTQAGGLPAGDTSSSSYVILKYVRTPYSDQPGTWKFYDATGSEIGTTFGTWQIVNQSDPDVWEQSTGTFSVEIIVGKTAKEANDGVATGDWDFQVKVIDDSNSESDPYTGYGYTINWYGEIYVTPNFAFGIVSPQSNNNPVTSPNTGYLDVYVVSNGNYDVNVKSDTQWIGVTDSTGYVNVTTATPGDKKILLKINANNDAGSASAIATTYTVWLDNQNGPTGDGDASAGNGAHHYAYLWLDVGSNIAQDTYVGHVYFQVTNA